MRTTTGFTVMIAAVLTFAEWGAAQEAAPVARWSFEQVSGPSVADTVGNHAGAVKGASQQVAGVDGQALKFDGGFVSVPSAPTLQFADARFSIAAWVNPYELDAGQQMIVAKNVYSAGKREWGLMGRQRQPVSVLPLAERLEDARFAGRTATGALASRRRDG